MTALTFLTSAPILAAYRTASSALCRPRPGAALRAFASMPPPSDPPAAGPPVPSSCEGCEGLTETLTAQELESYRVVLPDWSLDQAKISKEFRAKNFAEALAYLNRVGGVCEGENHHADMSVFAYNKVRIDLSTHSLGGVSLNDIIVAVKIDTLPVALSRRPL